MNRRLELTRGRIVVLIIGLPLALAAIVLSAFQTLGDLAAGTYPVRLDLAAHGRALTISIADGNLHLTTGVGGRMRLNGLARYQLLRPSVTPQVNGFGIVLISGCRLSITRCEFDYRLGLPGGETANLTDGKGDITGSGLASRDLTVVNRSGNITLRFAAIPDRLDLTATFGDITLVLPPGSTAYRVDASAPIGTSTIRVPTSPVSPHVLTLTDTSGSITVTN